MKSLRHAWERICSFENLLCAYGKARRGKRGRIAVQRFELERERNLLALQAALRDGSYRPGPHRTFRILLPKPRLIAAAPFRDRVVQHALCNVIQPVFENSFIPHTYACIAGRGTHRAVDRYSVRALNRRFAHGNIDASGVRASLMAWAGHTRHADARELERLVFSKVCLRHAAS